MLAMLAVRQPRFSLLKGPRSLPEAEGTGQGKLETCGEGHSESLSLVYLWPVWCVTEFCGEQGMAFGLTEVAKECCFWTRLRAYEVLLTAELLGHFEHPAFSQRAGYAKMAAGSA